MSTYSNASLIMPEGFGVKAGTLYNLKPIDGLADFTVDRNSLATHIDKDGILQTAAIDVPRNDYTDVVGCGHLLVEPQSTNIIPYSQEFTNATWNAQSPLVTRTANSAISPDGTLNATRITATASNGRLREDGVSINTLSYTNSLWIKRVSGVGDVKLLDVTGSGGAVTLTNEFQRFSITTQSVGTSGRFILEIVTSGDSVDVWGAQVEQQTNLTSYIKTEATTVTRLADDISVLTSLIVPAVTEIIETIDGVPQTPITIIPATYTVPEGNINNIIMN
jgi:hypothetical protein